MSGRYLCVLLAAALAACAPALVPGESSEADVRAAMGAPGETRGLADGARVLWYARPVPDTAYGSERYAATIGADGKLRALEQRLAPQYIAKLIPDQSHAAE